MSQPRALATVTAVFLTAAMVAVPGAVLAQDNPYRVADEAWGQLPEGRSWGALSAVFPGPDGRTVWVAERCGANRCVDAKGASRDKHPIHRIYRPIEPESRNSDMRGLFRCALARDF